MSDKSCVTVFQECGLTRVVNNVEHAIHGKKKQCACGFSVKLVTFRKDFCNKNSARRKNSFSPLSAISWNKARV